MLHIKNIAITLAILMTTNVQADDGLVAHWTFDEGKGQQLLDRSGHGHHGTLHGPEWVESGAGHALRFDGVDDYVDCGSPAGLDLRGPLSLELWVHPNAPTAAEPGILGKFFESYAITYYRGACWFYISSGGNAVIGSVKAGQWNHVAATFDGEQLRVYIDGQETGARPTKFPEAKPGGNFYFGCVFGDPSNPDPSLQKTAFFGGLMDSARVYSRALDPQEVVEHFNLEAEDKEREPVDPSLFGRLQLRSFLYPEDERVVVEANHRWIQPLPEDAVIRFSLSPGDVVGEVRSLERKPGDHADFVETAFSLKNDEQGAYQVIAHLLDKDGATLTEARTEFAWPPPASLLPAPSEVRAPLLPPRVTPPPYSLDVTDQGELTVDIGGTPFRIGSTFSYPDGGDNAMPTGTGAEPEWTVTARQIDDRTWSVRGEGAYYTIQRRVRAAATRIEIEDTLVNRTDDLLGIILSNHIDLRGIDGANPILHANPTVFAQHKGRGLGLIALDDVYYLQLNNRFYNGLLELRDEHFGLEKGASYTVRWAAYPTATDNYFDFINQLRHDEGINGRAEGGLTLSTGWATLSDEEVRNKGLGYLSQCYLTRITSDPVISIEGWEFMEYPEVMERIKRTLVASRSKHPGLKTGFHVAHSLYAMNDPDRFADSQAITASGGQVMYGGNTMEYYGKYFSKELVEDNWRWWIFVPTLTNSFGKLMLKGADVMIEELGANFIWADGFIEGYVKGGYVYNMFDGHSVDIDPATRRVTRRKANVTLTALPVLKEVARKFDRAGGRLVSNGRPGPPPYWKENVVTSNETGGGDQVPIGGMYLGKTVTPLGNPRVIHGERDVYLDALAKLDYGALYFFYGETDHRPGGHNYISRETLVTRMFPITFDTIQPGTVRGLERIVTRRSGVYGWPDDHQLHMVYLYDARGRRVANRSYSTVDETGTRTVIELADNESAVVEKIPARLAATGAVNLSVKRYDADGVEIVLRGGGEAELHLKDGPFAIEEGTRYRVYRGADEEAAESGVSGLGLAIDLARDDHLRIERVKPPAPAAVSTPVSKSKPPQEDPVNHVMKSKAYTLELEPNGRMVIDIGEERWLLDASFSYPGGRIGVNELSPEAGFGEAAWQPVVVKKDSDSAVVEAGGAHYSLRREIERHQERIVVRDTLENRSTNDVGILVTYRLAADQEVRETRLCGGTNRTSSRAENPTVFLRGDSSAVGAMARDPVLRVQYRADTGVDEATFGAEHIGLPPGESIALEWSIHPFAGEADYFDFINRLREEIGVNHTIPGPGGWLDVTREPLWSSFDDPKPLRDLLARNQVKVLLLSPWLDYENLHRQTMELIWRDEYKTLMKRGLEHLRGLDPELKIMASLEAPFVGLPDDLVEALYAVVPEPKKQGYYDMTAEMMDIFRQFPGPWKQWGDSLVYNEEGLAKFELYYRDARPLIALTVRPVVGNGQHDYLMEQARFVVEDVGFDGYYIDSFTGAQHWHYGYTYEKWDGLTVDIDRKTGSITRRYTDLALAGATARKAVIEYGVNQGKLVLVNGHPITHHTQGLGHMAFNESEWVFEPLEWMDGKPPLQERPCQTHLATPLALGFRPHRYGDEGKARYAEVLVKGAIAFLRHGMLYFHYVMDIPEEGPGAGEYGPFNHMFPITPRELGEGFVIGEERIVTCVSRSFQWEGDGRPMVLRFGLDGRRLPDASTITADNGGWAVEVQLDDWNNIAVVEPSPVHGLQ